MIFITTMPPTINVISVIGTTTAAIAPVNWSIWLPNSCVLTKPKVSSSLPSKLAFVAQGRARLFNRGGQSFALGGFSVNLHAVAAPEHLQMQRDRNINHAGRASRRTSSRAFLRRRRFEAECREFLKFVRSRFYSEKNFSLTSAPMTQTFAERVDFIAGRENVLRRYRFVLDFSIFAVTPKMRVEGISSRVLIDVGGRNGLPRRLRCSCGSCRADIRILPR